MGSVTKYVTPSGASMMGETVKVLTLSISPCPIVRPNFGSIMGNVTMRLTFRNVIMMGVIAVWSLMCKDSALSACAMMIKKALFIYIGNVTHKSKKYAHLNF